jgi:hypothetical protein
MARKARQRISYGMSHPRRAKRYVMCDADVWTQCCRLTIPPEGTDSASMGWPLTATTRCCMHSSNR